ncbi:MAG TPA: alpha/beta hydrolase [Solirubrobacteraceae bacterium]|nr:alpha/beta hydrolase [Solirubrobacteraceae bacterium]
MDDLVISGDGTQLVVRRHGAGRPVALVHPSAGGLESFDPIVPRLDGLELWIYARRGYAPSDGVKRAKTFADDIADLQAVLAAAGGRADVLGASYGATVALHAARTNGSGVRSLVLFEPPLFAAGAGLRTTLARYRACLDDGALAAAARVFAAEVARVPAPLLDALTGADDTNADRAEAIGCLHDLEAMTADTPDLDRWAAVEVPTLLMQGSETWAPMPATMDALAAVLPHLTRQRLAGQAHFATHTAPALFAGTVTTFLSTT